MVDLQPPRDAPEHFTIDVASGLVPGAAECHAGLQPPDNALNHHAPSP
jgi:hypothetical protein